LNKQERNPQNGYANMPPELGFDGGADYNRFERY
jgi:hypothetical protein